ncbi:MAG: bifunctional glutamate N-acetyltransferase/amino-acid acetyltransferase ArgJ, partial [Candidatus Omnitrophica bacterium]|nr:bifunctional glutamate N-acetyltransferase/amino-acid acetyltransferase ArgJ [Candidatus Omnitrophota bacterium]
GGITAPQGYQANGIFCGIKRSGKLDLGLIYSTVPTVTVGVFTKNSIKAAPLVVTMRKIKKAMAQAVIVNSGNANCYTGPFGLKYAEESTILVAKHLGLTSDHVLVTSTGIIGKQLPFNKIADGIPELVKDLHVNGAEKFAQAIMTTDLVLKEMAIEFLMGGKTIRIGACAKGSGMIEPNMATMLGFITTDAAINPKMLKLALKQATDISFNAISVDGCQSTNDMVTLMANGLAKNKPIVKPGKDFDLFCHALNQVCIDLAKKIVLDGEGATKFIEIKVAGAKNDAQAKTIALKIANSNLVKTAAFGSNPNWGRVAAAVGSLGLKITEDDLKINFSSFVEKNIAIEVVLNLGKGKAVVWTSDLSYDYVKINGEYN